MKNKIKTFISINLLILSVLIACSNQFDVGFAQLNGDSLTLDVNYSLHEFSNYTTLQINTDRINISLPNTNWNITNLELNFTDIKLGEEINFVNQKISDLQERVSEKDEELNSVNLKLQKFENANIQLSDLIVELKVLQDDNDKGVEFESAPKSIVYENLPRNLFFKMYRFLSEDDKLKIVNQLINDLKSQIRDIRTYAIKILSVIKGDRVFEVLKDIINDDDWIVKLYLIKAFRNFNQEDIIPLLKKMLEDKDTDVREAALSMLSDLKQS